MVADHPVVEVAARHLRAAHALAAATGSATGALADWRRAVAGGAWQVLGVRRRTRARVPDDADGPSALDGVVVLRPDGHDAEVLWLAVAPAARRRGVARALVDAAVAATAPGRLVLEVRADNTAARALYAAAGLHEVGQRPGYYADGGDALVLASPGREPR